MTLVQRRTPRRDRPPPRDNRNNLPEIYQPELPQTGLEQIGDSPFFATPNEPADPRDCNRYPNSPWCGENPINLESIADVGVDLVLDECNVGVQFSPSVGFISLPTFQLVYRNPNCIPPPPPPTPPVEDYEELPSIRILNGRPLIGYRNWEFFEEDATIGAPPGRTSLYTRTETFHDLIQIQEGSYPDKKLPTRAGIPNMRITFIVKFTRDFNGADVALRSPNTPQFPNTVSNLADEWRSDGGTISGDPNDPFSEWSLSSESEIVFYVNYPSMGVHYIENPSNHILYRYGSVESTRSPFVARFQSYQSDIRVPPTTFDPVSGFPYDRFSRTLIDSFVNFIDGWKLFRASGVTTLWTEPNWKPTIPPPEYKKKKDCCDMSCCQNNQNNDQLLRLILRRIGPLPASVPNSLVRANSGIRRIDSLAQYIAYAVMQTNAQFGQFPQEINIQDADLTQEGDQSKKITLPNLAESIAEIIGILLVLQSESNANLIATVNAMIEAGSAKQAAVLASDYAAGNAEFLGYKGKQIERKVAFTFKPGEQQLDKMLKPGEVKVKGWDNDDKNDLNDLIMPILEMAAMFRAQNFRNVGTSDPLGKIRDILNGAADISTAIDHLVNPPPTDPDAPIPQAKKSDWDAFTEQAETGFITQPGITDNTHPYGRPLKQRPKIREIGTDTSETDNEAT